MSVTGVTGTVPQTTACACKLLSHAQVALLPGWFPQLQLGTCSGMAQPQVLLQLQAPHCCPAAPHLDGLPASAAAAKAAGAATACQQCRARTNISMSGGSSGAWCSAVLSGAWC